MDRRPGLVRSGGAAAKELAEAAKAMFDNAFRFLETTFGQGQELVIFVTEITAGYDTSWFVEQFGCDAYYPPQPELLFDSTRRRIRGGDRPGKGGGAERYR